jgi:hypothetical protein
MKTLLCLLALLTSSTAFAGSFTLVDNVTQETYTCSSGGDNGGGDDGFDCIERVQAVCKKDITSGNGCYENAKAACKDKSRRFGRCVESTYSACRKEFSYGCYENAKSSCK